MNNVQRDNIGTDVMIVHQHPLMRRAIAMALTIDPSLRVVGSTGFGMLGIGLAQQHRPDVIIIVATNIAADNLELVAALKRANPNATILAMLPEDDLVGASALRAAGVTSFIDSYALPGEILAAVQANSRGDDPLYAPRYVVAPVGLPVELGAGDVNILELVAEGLVDAEIARRLYVSCRTVQSHLARLRSQTGCQNRAQLIVWFAQRFAVTLPN
jgi:two-component system response regulator NreC